MPPFHTNDVDIERVEASPDFLAGLVTGSALVGLAFVIWRVTVRLCRQLRYSEYTPILSKSSHADDGDELDGDDSYTTTMMDQGIKIDSVLHDSASMPQPVSTSANEREPPVVRHFRHGVRAVLGFVEISPEALGIFGSGTAPKLKKKGSAASLRIKRKRSKLAVLAKEKEQKLALETDSVPACGSPVEKDPGYFSENVGYADTPRDSESTFMSSTAPNQCFYTNGATHVVHADPASSSSDVKSPTSRDAQTYTAEQAPTDKQSRRTATIGSLPATHIRPKRHARSMPTFPDPALPPPILTSISSAPNPIKVSHRRSSHSSGLLPRKHSNGGLDRQYFAAEHTYEWTLPGYGRVKFVDHAPLAFKAVRRAFGYSHDELAEALDGSCKLELSEGKSDSIFFLTQNRKFLFKTLRGSEPENLKSILPDYISHIGKYPSTLLPRYLGMYTFERVTGHQRRESNGTAGATPAEAALGSRFTVVLIATVFDTPLEVHAKFDFKGSNVGRQALAADSTTAMKKRSSWDDQVVPQFNPHDSDMSELTLKEVDFQRLIAVGEVGRFRMGQDMKEAVVNQLEEDVQFLRHRGFMDYSLLIGVHRHMRTTPLPPRAMSTANHAVPTLMITTPTPPIVHPEVQPLLIPLSKSPKLTDEMHGSPKGRHLLTVFRSWVRPERGREIGPDNESRKAWGSLNSYTPKTLPSKRGTMAHSTHVAGVPAAASGRDTAILIDEESCGSKDEWEDEPNNPTPFHKRYHGGIRSMDMFGDVEYEVYFIGLIDILQKYNMRKWLEKNIMKRPMFRSAVPLPDSPVSAIPTSLVGLFSNDHSDSDAGTSRSARRGSSGSLIPVPPALPTSPMGEHEGVPTVMLPGMENEEMSVEEPGRYAERLVGFIKGVLL
ncbi:WD repeat-containing protein 78 [Gaertneriomyces sp. JEL0708]|nr:WD repeat-containing protein 78 [Gaertneriomyces sp. JEL0708]